MSLRTKILIQSRLKLIKMTIIELIEGIYQHQKHSFDSYSDMINTIELGIDKELLNKVTVIAKSGAEIKNILVFEIDWERHSVLCASPSGKIEFDGGKSIADQVSSALITLSKFIKNSFKDDKIDKIIVYYYFNDNIDLADAFKTLKLVNLSEEQIAELIKFNSHDCELEIKPERLDELTIRFQKKNK